MAVVVEMVGMSLSSVSRALRGADPLRPVATPTPAGPSPSQGELVPLARPEPREAERQAARAGLLEKAAGGGPGVRQ